MIFDRDEISYKKNTKNEEENPYLFQTCIYRYKKDV